MAIIPRSTMIQSGSTFKGSIFGGQINLFKNDLYSVGLYEKKRNIYTKNVKMNIQWMLLSNL